ncbi:hypothetical protein [Bartonella sp. MM73XJBT]|uniref:hypothetical protein n=2 Tax=unclassified Bartonella TaxID=2645622 RepID=UPI002361B12C|nr:hypothetical protein [Bartonella sp. MM73XJBT]
MLKNLDVTLRDGGYRNQFSFSLDYIIEHIKSLTKAQVEYIEIGYRKGSFKPMDNVGQTALCSNDYIKLLHDAIPDAKLVIIAHPHNIDQSDIWELKNLGITLLRLCLNKNDIESTFVLCHYASSLGLSTSINITRVSQIDENYLQSIAIEAVNCGANILYLADSNGSLLPETVTHFVQKIKDISPLEIGFHAHDNLGMAMANSIAAVDAGANFIDSSLLGMGKGAGNLTLELWLALLNLRKKEAYYNVDQVLQQTEKLKSQPFFSSVYRSSVDFLLALNNLSVEYQALLEAKIPLGIEEMLVTIQNLKQKA